MVHSNGGWHEQDQTRYVTMVAEYARYGLAAWDRLRDICGHRPPHPDEWRTLIDFLGHAARVARLLDPSTRQQPLDTPEVVAFRLQRGAKLRELLNIADGAPVLNRSVRNVAEHFDEYYDRWHLTQPHLTAEDVEGGGIGPIESPPNRLVDRDQMVVELVGQRMDLQAVADDLSTINRTSATVVPIAQVDDPNLGYLLSGLPTWPSELRLNAPTNRPNESVVATPERGHDHGGPPGR